MSRTLRVRLALLAAAVTAASTACPDFSWAQLRDLCYRRPGGEMLPWADTESFCQQLSPGSTLASVHDEELNDFVGHVAAGGYASWVGLYRTNDTAPWVWTDGSELDYTSWRGHGPDCAGECCVYVNSGYDDDAPWEACECGRSQWFVCQTAAS